MSPYPNIPLSLFNSIPCCLFASTSSSILALSPDELICISPVSSSLKCLVEIAKVLFEPLNGYSWKTTDITLPDELFSNENSTKEGDTGDGILVAIKIIAASKQA